jgi:hypothetical protein
MKLSQLLGYWGVLLFLPWAALAQQPLLGESVGWIEQKVAVHAYAGQPYRLSMRARVDSTRTGGAKVDVVAFVFDQRHALLDFIVGKALPPGPKSGRHIRLPKS